MIEWLGIEHLFELSGAEAIAGFFTPLAIFAAFFIVQFILPGRKVLATSSIRKQVSRAIID